MFIVNDTYWPDNHSWLIDLFSRNGIINKGQTSWHVWLYIVLLLWCSARISSSVILRNLTCTSKNNVADPRYVHLHTMLLIPVTYTYRNVINTRYVHLQPMLLIPVTYTYTQCDWYPLRTLTANVNDTRYVHLHTMLMIPVTYTYIQC